MLHTADSARKKVSERLCGQTLQIIRFGVPLLGAWCRVAVMPRAKGTVSGSPERYTARTGRDWHPPPNLFRMIAIGRTALFENHTDWRTVGSRVCLTSHGNQISQI